MGVPMKSFRLALVTSLVFLLTLNAWAKPLLLISIDGFRPDYLSESKSPKLWEFAQEGVRAKSLKPIFPSLTFPNHFTLVTGLYAPKHGITANEIRDPNIPFRFTLGAPSQIINDPRWWKGEPIWVTAHKQGLKSGTMFWPGSEAAIQNIRPDYYLPYNQGMTNAARVEQLLKWIDLPANEKPQLFTLYFDTVDTAGHQFGPDSDEVTAAIKEADENLGTLFTALRDRGIYDEFNIIIVSDHGMALLDEQKYVDISGVVAGFPNVERIGNGAVAGFFSSDTAQLARLETALHEKSTHYQLYKKASIPARYHYSDSDRVPDLLLVANEGASVNLRPSFMPQVRAPYLATHGYDNDLASMQATFIARGPAFSTNRVVDAFDNINIYALMCKLLEITPSTNDGSVSNLPNHLLR